jgi:hypothetical protein
MLGSVFKKFVEASPVSVMVQGTLERIFDPTKVQQVFDDNAVRQDTKELTFDQCLGIMSDVVFQVTPSSVPRTVCWRTGTSVRRGSCLVSREARLSL